MPSPTTTNPPDKRRDPQPSPKTSPAWHALGTEEVRRMLEAPTNGLGDEEASRRLARHGPNRLPEPPRAGVLTRFLRQFANLLIYVLLTAAAVTALLGHWVDTVVILAVVVVNATIGFIQEGRAEQALSAIRGMLAPRARLVRDDRRVNLPAEELVPGDRVLLEAGDKVPADLRLTTAHGLRIQEAALTGESVAVDKTTVAVAEDAALGDRSSMAFSGSMVAAGTGEGVVVATGSTTEIGRISGMLQEVEGVTTPLLKQMERFARTITLAIVALAAFILVFGFLFADLPFPEIFMAVVGLAVAAIPEGLPAILTVTLAIGVQAMARRNAIVRRLPAIETLGSVSVICSDKTGTLTRNEMTVASVATARQFYTVSGTGYGPEGEILSGGEPVAPDSAPLLAALARSALLCNDAELAQSGEDWTVNGDPMEGALLAFTHKAGLDPREIRASYPRTAALPFDSAHRFMATLHQRPEGEHELQVKGAPERILAMCTTQRTAENGTRPLETAYWHSRAGEIAARGERVLALATRPAPAADGLLSAGEVGENLTLLGLVGLLDPPREEAITAVAECRAAGIDVKMITGDHAGTAAAIGSALGLGNTEKVLTGTEIDALSPEELQAQASRVDVFARTSPAHKLRLVEALQAGGQAVAMTGDGVNDAPALKRADIGIAMGRNGTEAAKEAAEIVLADDNFATIAAAVKAGRTVYDNLKKAVAFLLPVNGGEALALIAALLLGLTLPISPVQILWVNMVSSVVLAMTLAFEGPEADLMRRPPRSPGEPILSGFVLWRVAFVSVLFSLGIFGMFTLALRTGASLEEARTVAVNTLVVMEIFYLFSVRFLRTNALTLQAVAGTRPILITISAVTLLQFLFTYAPFMEALFDTRPVRFLHGLLLLTAGPLLLLLLETEKRVRRLLAERRTPPTPTSAP